MDLINPFDATQVDPTQSAGQLPIGKHPVIVQSSEVLQNKAGDGGYLQLNLNITDGPHAGSGGAYRINLYHNNQTTVEIAQRQLSAVCHVTGVFQLKSSQQLHNIPFVVEVGPQKNDAQYTEVKRVFDANGNEPGKGNGGGQAQQQQQQPAQNNQGGGWGGQQQQAPAQQQQPAWGGQPAQNQQQQPANNAGGGWSQNQGGQGNQGGTNAPWNS